MFNIVNIFLYVVMLVIVFIFIYKIYYTYKINKKIQSGEITGRKLMDLSKVVMIAVITGLIIYVAILILVIRDYASQEHRVPRNNYAVIDVSDGLAYKYVSYLGNVQLDDASFAKVYNKEENIGYKKEIVESGNYIFTIFTRTAKADDFHPDFLCYVDYIGSDMGDVVCYSKAGFQSVENEEEQFGGESSGSVRGNLLYIGKLDFGCKFYITISLLDDEAEMKYLQAMQKAYEEDKGEFPDAEKFAVGVGTAEIVIE